MTKRLPYSKYFVNPALFEDFVLEDARGQAMFMQDAISEFCNEERPEKWFLSGFHDVLGHVIDMTEAEFMGTATERRLEVEKRKQILMGAISAMNALMEMTKEGDFKREAHL